MTLREAAALLRAVGCEDAMPSARALFRHVAACSDTDLFGGDPSCDDPALIDAIHRRAAGEPVAYLIGYTDFFRERYRVTPDVLIPRPETELLVEYAVAHLREGARILDLCTGSGCIGLSVLANTKDTRATLADLSDGALRVARQNADSLGLSSRATIVKSDVRCEVVDGRFDAILSNPPYVSDAVYPTLCRDIFFEPAMAFVGGEDGMDFYVAILRGYADRLTEDGFFAFEIGYDQGERIVALARAYGFTATLTKDLAGHDRLAILRRT
ncbi:MAG: peptide chain release factor N(5)-glutamine methyltransferase [Clostridia bacterium]|nr:peptide chain release factor N(5)-glutamine methyltransferase [Clostridia bacterium]